MEKIIFIEGLPGSGKTTFAKRLKTYLSNLDYRVISYSEGDLHPVDLAWVAILTKQELADLSMRYPSLKKEIFSNIKLINDRYFLAYIQVEIDSSTKDFYEYCERYEIYRKDDLSFFLKEHLDLWERFSEVVIDNEFTYIFECILLQNQINELLLKYNLSKKDILKYYQSLLKPIKVLNVKLIYIRQNNVAKIFQRIANERISNNKELYKDWIEHVIEYIENTNFSKINNYRGYDGALKYFKHRQEVELEILNDLGISFKIIDLNDDYDEVFNLITKEFK